MKREPIVEKPRAVREVIPVRTKCGTGRSTFVRSLQQKKRPSGMGRMTASCICRTQLRPESKPKRSETGTSKEGLRIDPPIRGWKFERYCCQGTTPLKAFLTDDKDALWDCDRAQMRAGVEGIGGEKFHTGVRIENDALKLIASTGTAIGDN
jgi:hypothetical protein